MDNIKNFFSNKRFRYIMIGLLIFFIIACVAIVAAIPGFIWVGNKNAPCYQPLTMMWVDNSTESCKELGTICARCPNTTHQLENQCYGEMGCGPCAADEKWYESDQKKETKLIMKDDLHCAEVANKNNIRYTKGIYYISIIKINETCLGLFCKFNQNDQIVMCS